MCMTHLQKPFWIVAPKAWGKLQCPKSDALSINVMICGFLRLLSFFQLMEDLDLSSWVPFWSPAYYTLDQIPRSHAPKAGPEQEEEMSTHFPLTEPSKTH